MSYALDVTHKMTAPWPATISTHVTKKQLQDGDGSEVVEFIERLCLQVKDSVGGNAGEPLMLRPWQKSLVYELYARRSNGRLKHKTALIGMARKNGKSVLGSGLALHGLLMGPVGAEVYSCAADRDQARIVFGSARRMVEMSSDLSKHIKVYRDALEIVKTGSIYRVLSSEAYSKEGLSPTLVLYDELHAAPNDDLWNVMTLAQAARVDSLTIAITTAGVRTDATGSESTAFRLFQYGTRVAKKEIDDESFYMAWWQGAPEGSHKDPKSWPAGNPGFGDLQNTEDFESAVKRTPENEFRIKRMNMWVSSQHAWLPYDALTKLQEHRVVNSDVPVVIGFDGSFNGDATVIVGCTIEPIPYVWLIDVWEKTPLDPDDWRVPISTVEHHVKLACTEWNVVEVACDPFRWQRSMEALADEGVPITEYASSSPARMVPATTKFYDAITNDGITHDGNATLLRHLSNCVVKIDRLGPRIVKEHRGSSRRIDAAVAAVIAFDRATARREQVAELAMPGFFTT